MGSRDTRKLQVLRQHASGVSRALWPAEMRRSLATGRLAQRRRSLVLNGKWGTLLAIILRLGPALALVAISMLVGGTIVAALVLRLWYLLLIPTVVLTVGTLAITLPFLLKLYRTFHPLAIRTSRELRALPIFPPPRRSPETPLPTAPLVRILETYDLSQTDVEHFLDTSRAEEHAMQES